MSKNPSTSEQNIPVSPSDEILANLFWSLNLTSESVNMAASIEQEKAILEARKAHLFSELTKISNIVTAQAFTGHVKAQVYLRQLERLESSWSAVETEIISLNSQITVARERISIADVDTFNTIINTIAERCLQISAGQAVAGQLPVVQQAQYPLFKAKIDVPLFDGLIAHWTPFKSSYDSLVHTSTSMSGVDKLQYLRSRLKNEAYSIVSRYPLIEANYALAYEELVNRFDNKRRLGSYFLQQLLSFKGKDACLTEYLSKTRAATDGLTNLGIDNLADFMLFELSYLNLSLPLQKLYDRSLEDDNIPTLKSLIEFTQKLARTDEIRGDKLTQVKPPSQTGKPVKSTAHATASKATTSSGTCLLCKGAHRLYMCENLNKMTVQARLDTVKNLNCCSNCLNTHRSPCKSQATCRECGSSDHHTLLHVQSANLNSSGTSSGTQQVTVNSCQSAKRKDTLLLGTVQCQVADAWGKYHQIRAVLDSCSETSIISNKLFKMLGLKARRAAFDLRGITQDVMTPKGCVHLDIKPLSSDISLPINAVIIEKVCSDLPSQNLNLSLCKSVDISQLADPTYNIKAPVDVLIGADGFLDCLSEETPSIVKGRPGALRTIFGWVIMGHVDVSQYTATDSAGQALFAKVEPLENLLTKFWETENVSYPKANSHEDALSESIFMQHQRTSTGRYVLRLPIKPDAPAPGNNRAVAEKRLRAVQRQLSIKPELAMQYSQFLADYLSQGHMTPAINPVSYLLPHHAVHHPTSRKLRVVFDGSAIDDQSQSLNSRLMAGPSLHNSVDVIILDFRFHVVAMVADIRQMFRQIGIHPDDRHLQHIIWINDSGKIEEYELNTVTYGIVSSPYQAIRTLRQLADDEGADYPRAAHSVRKHGFMDDFPTGAESVEGARQLQQELIELLGKAGFELRKWSCSHSELLDSLPETHLEKPIAIDASEVGVKILGLLWEPGQDAFRYLVEPFTSQAITKRTVLSYIARIYDIMGYLNPIVFRAKCFMQTMWLAHVGWDDELDHDLTREWVNFTEQLPLVANLRIPRLIPSIGICRLIVFADASEKGMAACAYLQSEGSTITSHLVKAKSQVAPLKQLTINKLELGAAVLAAKLARSVADTIDISLDSVHLFTDSKTVLLWLRKPVHLLKTFEANRVTQIHELTAGCTWRHVESASNPADLNSRGVDVHDLMTSQLWWHGPTFLQLPPSAWVSKYVGQCTTRPNQPSVAASPSKPPDIFLIERFSSLTKLTRVMAYILRFIKNCRQREKVVTPLSASELRDAVNRCVLISQQSDFKEVIKQLQANRPVVSKELSKLSPYLDETQLLRVGGRLGQASFLPYHTKHPLLLDKGSHLAKLICEHYHRIMLHSGPRATESMIRTRYWIISMHRLVKSVIHHCTYCFRLRANTTQPIMAELPAERLTKSFAFDKICLDFAGPIMVKESNLRKSTQHRSYIAVFVCMSTKAIHLELVTELSTPAFLAAFARFTSRRNVPRDIFSDCGTNFVGASRILRECATFLRAQQVEIFSAAAAIGTQWHFNAPAAPNFNGLAEAGVKSTKLLLLLSARGTILTFEEFATLLCRVEAALNSRPLTAVSPDPGEADLCYLTPGHFLTGRALLSPPEEPVEDSTSSTTRQRFKVVQQLAQTFWRTWSSQYLHQLMQRQRWTQPLSNLQPGDVVYLTGLKATTPLSWPLARVTEVYPSADGVVRVVKLRLGNGGYLTRPVNKLVMVPMEE